VAIGEDITYDVVLNFTEGTTAADSVVDTLPAGLVLVAGSPQVITTAAASGGLLPADFNGTMDAPTITELHGATERVTFGFSNVVVTGDNDTTNNAILLRFHAQVADVIGNQQNTTITNNATNQVNGGALVATNSVTATVVEPVITFTKTIVSTPTPLDAGGVVHYRLTYANGSGHCAHRQLCSRPAASAHHRHARPGDHDRRDGGNRHQQFDDERHQYPRDIGSSRRERDHRLLSGHPERHHPGAGGHQHRQRHLDQSYRHGDR
jgi:uncharacterized repeat protein (TIGR01451 family)